MTRRTTSSDGTGLGPLLLLLLLVACTHCCFTDAQSSSTGAAAVVGHWETFAGNCSVPCGPGLRFSSPACVLDAQIVADGLCNSTATKPEPSSAYCNLGACVVTLTAWRIVDHRCGADAPAPNGNALSECDPDSAQFFCCSSAHVCGSQPIECSCDGCVDYRLLHRNISSPIFVPQNNEKSISTTQIVLIVICAAIAVVILYVVYRIVVRWAKRRAYLAEAESKRNPRAEPAPPPSVAAAGARVFGPAESAAIAAGVVSASNRRPKRPSRNSVAPAPAPSASPSPSVSGLQGPPAIPRLHLLAPPSAAAPGAPGYAVVQSSASSPSPSPRSFLGMAVSPREIEIESAREGAAAAAGAASSSAPAAASSLPVPASSPASSPPLASVSPKPTIAALPPVFLHAAPSNVRQRGRTLPPLQQQHLHAGAASFAAAGSPPSPATAPSSSPLSLIDRTQHLSFGQRGGGGGSGTYAALGPASAAAGSASGGGNLTPRTPRSFGGRTDTPPSSPPPRLRTPTRHASSGSVGGHMSPAARAALAEPMDAPDYGLDAGDAAGLGSASAAAGAPLCSICMSRPSDAFLVPCGHSNFCYGCVQRWTSGASAHEQTCPVCRTAVQSVSKIVNSPQTPKR